MNLFSRTQLLIGSDGIEALKDAKVAVFGIGGVGSYTVEALARSGVGTLVLIDNDTVEESNINRQLIATCQNIDMPKTQAAKDRILSINPEAKVICYNMFYDASTADNIDYRSLTYIVDAIDTVSSKLLLIEKAKTYDVPIISCMGAGNKLNSSGFKVADIAKTTVCPLARVMRCELRKRNIKGVKVVYSEEIPKTAHDENSVSRLVTAESSQNTGIDKRRQTPGSIAFVTGVAGLIAAGEVINDICGL